MPLATCRIIPARTRSLWLTTSASAGSSRSVGARYEERRRTAALIARDDRHCQRAGGAARRPGPHRAHDSRRRLVRLVLALERQPAVPPRGAGGHGHRDEARLADLLLGDARLLGPLHVRVDAPRALGDLRDAERDQLLRLHVERASLEALLVELEPRPVRLARELA